MFDKVKKRDGRVVPYEKEKVAQAIFKAAKSVGGTDIRLARELANKVERYLEEKLGDETPDVETIQDTVEKILIEEGHAATAKAYILYRQKRTEIREAKSLLTGVEDDIKLTLNAVKVLEQRYLMKDSQGNVIESPSEMFQRVAKDVAKAELDYGGEEDYKKWSREFYDLMSSLLFLPNSPTLMNAGTSLQQLSACFVLPVPDSMEEIFNAVKYAALIHKSGGGTGFSFSRLRPSDDIVQSTGGIASGPISFMRVFDTATDVIKQGGRRRGANMGILRYDHPDIFDFITLKDARDSFSNFNISVGIDEEFMNAVENNNTIELKNPRNKKPVRTVKARALFDLLVYNAWKTGDPGIVFLDRLNKDNPTPHIGEIESTNPCVTGDTLVPTEHGLIRIDELYSKYSQGGLKILTDNRVNLKKLKVANGSSIESVPDANYTGISLHTVSQIYNNGKKEVFKLKTRAGYEIKATPDHKFLTEKGWKKLENIEKGDFVLIQSAKGIFSKEKSLPFNVERNFIGKNGRNYTYNFPEEWSKELGQVLGLLLGDGWLRRGDKNCRVGFTFSKDDGEILEYFKPLINEFYGKDIKEIERKNGVYHLSYHSKYFVKFFSKLGMKAAGAEMKEVPESIFTAPYEAVVGFLQGIFTADGTVSLDEKHDNYCVRLSSKSEKLLKDIQILLLNLGIKSSFYNRSRNPRKNTFSYTKKNGKIINYDTDGNLYELNISRASLRTFAEEINFLISRKREVLNKIITEKNLHRETMMEEVVSKELLGKEIVYDLTEPVTHSFISNGLITHNCGEQPLLPYEACNLGSINLEKMVENEAINYELLGDTVSKSVRFLDDVIDRSKFPLKEIEERVNGNRKIGLGVMGFADLLIQLGIPYDSEEALSVAGKIMKFISEEARKESENLADSRGPFPNFENSTYDKNGDPPIRNATRLTIAPTGTISILGGCSSGIEPLFAVVFIRNVMEGTELMESNKYFEKIARNEGFYSDNLMRQVARTGSVQDVRDIPDKIKRIFVTAHDVDPEWHVRMQAAFQEWVDNAVSKTVNLSYYATPQDVEKIYMLGYKLGVKGITIYRDGSKSEQVLYRGSKREKENQKRDREKPGPGKMRSESLRVDLSEGMLKVDSDYSGGCETCEF